MIRYGLQWQALQDYLAIEETSNSSVWGEGAAGTPPDNHVFIYAKDKSGTSGLFWKNDAGTEFDLSGITSASGAAGRVAIWTATTVLNNDASLRWDNTNKWLGVGNSAPTSAIDVAGGTDALTDVNIRRASADANSGGYTMLKARGSIGSEAATQSGDALGIVGFGGFTTAAAFNKATVRAFANELWSGTASGCYLMFEVTRAATTTRAEAMRVQYDATSAGFPQLLIGRTTAISNTNATIDVSGNGAVSGGAQINLFAFGSAVAANFRGIHARGTPTGPTASSTDDPMSAFSALGYDGSAYQGRQAGILLCAGSLWSGSNRETYIRFDTTANASTTNTERFRIGPSGQFGIGGATYGTANNIFKSGGASAAPSWGTINLLDSASIGDTLTGTVVRGDLIVGNSTPKWSRFAVGGASTLLKSNGTDPSWLDYTTDWLSQYALLAGRSGGQTLIGGTAAADGLILRATAGVGVGSESVKLQVGSNGASTIVTVTKVTGSTATVELNSATASQQINLSFADNGTSKWIIYKTTGNSLRVWDSGANADIMIFTPITSLAATAAAVKVGPTISNPNATTIGVLISPTFTGAGEGPWGASISATFTPSASIGACYNSLNQGTFGPPVSVTITSAFGAYYACIYSNTSGAVTSGFTLWLNAPTISGSLKPASQYGLYVQNQGAAGITSAYAAYFEAQSGATNNFVFGFGTVDTTAAGAYYGRIPVLYNGLLKYMHIFSA